MMRSDEILWLLWSRGPLSGEAIARELGVSRAAVWKHIKSLRAEGYCIEGERGGGYSLCDDDILSSAIVERYAASPLFSRCVYMRETTSTNRDAFRAAVDGAPEGTIFLAERQTGGRGRMGREWHSPSGGLWLSAILRPELPPSAVPGISMAGGLAIKDTLSSFGIEAGVKWPNDVYVGGKKVSGVLGEVKGEADVLDFVILGIGLNVNMTPADFPSELKGTATSMRIAAGHAFRRADVLRTLLAALERRYTTLLDSGMEGIREDYMSALVIMGRNVVLDTPAGRIEGRVAGIDTDGALLLDREGEVKRITAGTVVKTY